MTDDLTIYPDETRGHIVFERAETDATFAGHERRMLGVDMGDVLNLHGSLVLTPCQARRVADSLNWWADRHPEPEPEPLEGQGAFDLTSPPAKED